MIDDNGYRQNVGIVICNYNEQVLWAKRYRQHSWQFPQGGIHASETAEQAMYRELHEEIGLRCKDVRILASTRNWIRYKLPNQMIRWDTKPVCIGQKQKWFLLKLICADTDINTHSKGIPEFDGWRWVSFWYPVRQIVSFKRHVYRRVMKEFSSVVMLLHETAAAEFQADTQKKKRLNKADYTHKYTSNR
ncbi:RNA pyrophosphohydrolase [Sodalis endosymbiont of Henestaris halophilus]|uniref:RNA pyrophosphohydrolase n=1 Tax=Sodalis endosymbiont of Henestaris halophilus TaxID=1929246 RepID=UPI000BC09E77|nr:RNA pyrophosphohydrolase [Sodalis endosymbiont of Henestaris halophilus]SNC58294.1 RNA pyrophosphohydrolase [Sodalis endosymbiont of Henestaris halophilus]